MGAPGLHVVYLPPRIYCCITLYSCPHSHVKLAKDQEMHITKCLSHPHIVRLHAAASGRGGNLAWESVVRRFGMQSSTSTCANKLGQNQKD